MVDPTWQRYSRAARIAQTRVKRIKAKRVPSKGHLGVLKLAGELFEIFEQDHGKVLRELRDSQARAQVCRTSPGIATKLDLYERAQALLGGGGRQ